MSSFEYTPKELSNLSDEMIKDLFLSIRSKILLDNCNKKEKKELEIYYCYIFKELENRSKTK